MEFMTDTKPISPEQFRSNCYRRLQQNACTNVHMIHALDLIIEEYEQSVKHYPNTAYRTKGDIFEDYGEDSVTITKSGWVWLDEVGMVGEEKTYRTSYEAHKQCIKYIDTQYAPPSEKTEL